jgi:hypothetical protein
MKHPLLLQIYGLITGFCLLSATFGFAQQDNRLWNSSFEERIVNEPTRLYRTADQQLLTKQLLKLQPVAPNQALSLYAGDGWFQSAQARLSIYDGPDTLSPIIGTYSAQSPIVHILQSTHPTGCLTLFWQNPNHEAAPIELMILPVRQQTIQSAKQAFYQKQTNNHTSTAETLMTGGCTTCPSTINATPAATEVCEGNCTSIAADARMFQIIRENFNSGIGGLFGVTNGVSSAGCGSLDASNALYFDGSELTRYAETAGMNIDGACYIAFDIVIGSTRDVNPIPGGCEDSDLPLEQVKLQYALGAGGWIDVMEFDNGGPAPGPFGAWTRVCIPIPPGANSTNTRFRFIQNAHSGFGRDQWAIDNFEIPNRVVPSFTWTGPSIASGVTSPNATVCPTSDAQYIVTARSGATILRDTVNIRVIRESTIRGTITGDQTVCPTEVPAAIRVSGFRGDILLWQRSENCDGRWESISITSPDLAPRNPTTVDCYRAVIMFGECVVFSQEIKVERNNLPDVDTLLPEVSGACVNQPYTLQGVLPPGYRQVGIWERSQNEGPWSPSPGNADRWAFAKLTDYSCLRTKVEGRFCDPLRLDTLTYTQCVQPFLKARDGFFIPDVVLLECVPDDTVRKIDLRGYFPEMILGWEIFRVGASAWEAIPGSANSLFYQEPAGFPVGTCFRVNLDLPKDTVNCTVWKAVPPFCINESPCGGCEITATPVCKGSRVSPPMCLRGDSCKTVLEWQSGLPMAGSRDCDNLSIIWTPFASTAGLNCFSPPNPIYEATCFRVRMFNSSSRDTFFSETRIVNILPGPDFTNMRIVHDTSGVCAGNNNGVVILNTPLRSPDEFVGWYRASWKTPKDFINFNTQTYLNLTDSTIFYYVATSRNGCKDTLRSIMPVELESAGGRVDSSRSICTGFPVGTLFLRGQRGKVERWEFSNKDCNGPWVLLTSSNVSSISIGGIPENRCFRAVVKNGKCSEAVSATALIQLVDIPLPGEIQAPVSTCAGENMPIIRVTGYTGEVVNWQEDEGCIDRWLFRDPPLRADSLQLPPIFRNRCLRVQVSNGACTITGPTTMVAVSPPTLAGTVSGDELVCPLQMANLTLSESTGRILFWEATQDTGKTWTTIANTTLRLVTTPLTQRTCYRATVQAALCPRAVSNLHCVDVLPAAKGGRLEPNQDVCLGADPHLMQLSNFVGTVDRWESSANCSGAWAIVPGVTSTSFKPTSIVQRTCYRVLLKSGVCTQSFSDIDTINVNPPSESGTIVGGGTVCVGSPAPLLRLNSHLGIILKWETSEDGILWDFAPGSAGQTDYQLPVVNQRTRIRVLVQNAPCPAETSDVAIVDVLPPSPTGTLSGKDSICRGESPNDLQLNGNVGAVKRWEFSENECNGPWTTISHTTTSFSPGALTSSRCYRVVVDGGVCAEAVTNSIPIVVVQPASRARIIGGGTFCGAVDTIAIRIEPATSTVRSWNQSSDGITWTAITGTTTLFRPGRITANTWYKAMIGGGICPQAFTDSVLVRIKPETQVGQLVGNQTVCFGEPARNLHIRNQSGSVLYWEVSKDSLNWTNMGKAGLTTIESGRVTTINWFRAAVQNDDCAPQVTNPVRVDVFRPLQGGALLGAVSTCEGIIRPDLRLQDFQGMIFRWEFSADSGKVWQIINHRQATYQPEPITATRWYRVMINGNGCGVRYSTVAAVNVFSSASGGNVKGSGTVCFGQQSPLLTVTGFQGDIVRWEASKDNGSRWQDIGKAGVRAHRSGRLTTTTWFRAVISAGNCPLAFSTPARVDVERLAIGGQLLGTKTHCGPIANTTLQLVNHRGTIQQWEESADSLTWNPISHFEPEFTINNSTQTRFYRVQIAASACPATYSSVAAIRVLPQTDAGQLAQSDTVCFGSTSSPMQLSGFIGNILHWEASKDGGNGWQAIGKSGLASIISGRLTVDTWFRAVVQSPGCARLASQPVKMTIVRGAVAQPTGSITGTSPICAGSDALLVINGFIGTVNSWEWSVDNWRTVQSIANTSSMVTIPNVLQTTQFRAQIAQLCGILPSGTFTVEVQAKPSLSVESSGSCDPKTSVRLRSNAVNALYEIEPFIRPRNRDGLFADLPLRSYRFTVQDQNGCKADTTITLQAIPPVAPRLIRFESIDLTQALVRWNRVAGSEVRYTLKYRILGSERWATLSGIRDTTRILTGLQHGTTYEALLGAACSTDPRSPILWDSLSLTLGRNRFQTLSRRQSCFGPELPIPTGLYLSGISSTSARVHWRRVFDGPGYILSFGPSAISPLSWTQINICNPDTFYQLNGLLPNIEYRVRIRTNCSNCTSALQINDRRSDWSRVEAFNTLPLRQSVEATGSESFAMQLYPNPNKGQFKLRILNEHNVISPETGKISLFDINGALVWSDAAERFVNGQCDVQLHENLSPGLYLLTFEHTAIVQRFKLILTP